MRLCPFELVPAHAVATHLKNKAATGTAVGLFDNEKQDLTQ
jgi:hypothetical protein